MTLMPSWQTDGGQPVPATSRLLRVLVLIASGAGLGVFWRELFQLTAHAFVWISSLG